MARIESGLDTGHLLPETTRIVVPYLQMTYAVFIIQDRNQQSISLVLDLERDNEYADTNMF